MLRKVKKILILDTKMQFIFSQNELGHFYLKPHFIQKIRENQ